MTCKAGPYDLVTGFGRGRPDFIETSPHTCRLGGNYDEAFQRSVAKEISNERAMDRLGRRMAAITSDVVAYNLDHEIPMEFSV